MFKIGDRVRMIEGVPNRSGAFELLRGLVKFDTENMVIVDKDVVVPNSYEVHAYAIGFEYAGPCQQTVNPEQIEKVDE